MMKATARIARIMIVTAAFCLTAAAQQAQPQSKCPVMGGKTDKKDHVDVKGYRVYVCCPACIAKVKADPDAAIAKIKANGEVPEPAPVVLCKRCGQLRGADLCCKPGQKKCGKCGLAKGSPGCCRIAKDAKDDVVLCPGCGEIKGGDKCCKTKGRKRCGKCRLLKGSPGCCRMPAPQAQPPKAKPPKDHPAH